MSFGMMDRRSANYISLQITRFAELMLATTVPLPDQGLLDEQLLNGGCKFNRIDRLGEQQTP